MVLAKQAGFVAGEKYTIIITRVYSELYLRSYVANGFHRAT